MAPPTFLVLLDALRWDYVCVQDSPTLVQLANAGIWARKVRPSFGFCEISECVTGTRPNVNGNFAAFAYGPQASPYRRWRGMLRLLGFVDRLPRGQMRARQVLEWWFAVCGVPHPTYRIPLPWLSYFVPTEGARLHTQAGAFAVESVYDVMARAGRAVYDETFVRHNRAAGSDVDRVERLLRHCAESYDLFMIYLGEADGAGHDFGPDSPQRRETVKRLDALIARLVERVAQVYGEAANLVVLGDHGMVPVAHTVDVWSSVGALGLEFGRDYVMFLDSTLARFWPLSERGRAGLRQLLAQREFATLGELLTPERAEELHVPPPDSKYGEIIWLAHANTMIFPDFFNRVVSLGMHGYETSLDEQKGFAVVVGPDVGAAVLEEVELVDICPTLCDLLSIEYPRQNQGISLLGR
ncbi:MAG: alkaline phosphatase family protein [Anaerolineae bacterium]